MTRLVVVRGAPTPEELAAVLAVVTSRAAAAPPPSPEPERPLWAQPRLRAALAPGPGAWRASGLPR